jgi:hypothetical protein
MSAQPNDNQQLAERVLSKVQSEGASGDLIIDAGESLSLKARDGELEEYKVFGLSKTVELAPPTVKPVIQTH